MKTFSTRQVVIRIAAIIALAEFSVMLSLMALPYEVNPFLEAIYDTVLLTLLTMPAVYHWVIKPFVEARDYSYDRVSRLAHFDLLTNVANRRLLSNHLRMVISGACRHKIYGAMLFLDLNKFKPVNDIHGHDAGDAVLVEVANRMVSITRDEDLVARIGGDEFGLVVSHLDADRNIACEKALRIAENLISIMSNTIEFEDKSLHIGASIGIRLIDFEEQEPECVIREADMAMYRAKQAGGRLSVVFE